ncbi:MAG: SMP-30/gluconolactonase/LRE family protein, partial [Polaromonas sp.]|nr:SMP-30/gluconolactonase/LRE family protein [Polaromonas sp.]
MSWTTTVAQPSELGESPFWHPDEQLLYWVDIAGKQIKRSNVFMGTVESWAMAPPHELEPGCIAPARSGGLVIALRDGIYRARIWGGALEKLAGAAHDPQTTR